MRVKLRLVSGYYKPVTVLSYSYGVGTVVLLENRMTVMRFHFYSHALTVSGYCDLASICVGKEFFGLFY